MNTVLYRLVCIPFNGRFSAMFTSSDSFMRAFKNCQNHKDKIPTLYMLTANKFNKITKDKK